MRPPWLPPCAPGDSPGAGPSRPLPQPPAGHRLPLPLSEPRWDRPLGVWPSRSPGPAPANLDCDPASLNPDLLVGLSLAAQAPPGGSPLSPPTPIPICTSGHPRVVFPGHPAKAMPCPCPSLVTLAFSGAPSVRCDAAPAPSGDFSACVLSRGGWSLPLHHRASSLGPQEAGRAGQACMRGL